MSEQLFGLQSGCSTISLLVAVAVTNSATLGYDSNVMNGLLILPSYTEYFRLTTATTGLNNAAMWMGGLLASPFMQLVPDILGRKAAIVVATAITAVGIVLQAAAQHISMFLVARIIVGIRTAINNVSAPALLGELLPSRSRTRVLGARDSSGLEQAMDSAESIRMVIEKEAEEYPSNPWKELVSGKANLKRVFILVTFGTMINTCGNFIISTYLSKILDQAGITETYVQTQVNVIIQCWSFAIAVLGSFMLDIIGRRLQLLGSQCGMVVMLFLMGGLIRKYGESEKTSAIYGTIAVIFLLQAFYAFSITPMTSSYPMEICQYKLRATGITLFRFFDSGFGLMGSFAMSYAMDDLGWKFYFINGSWIVAFIGVVYFAFVETKGLQLEDIAVKFGDMPVLEAVEVGVELSAPPSKIGVSETVKPGDAS
ncbi:MFS general substrate transporter [Hortaea werneckii]|nr:MFS general substrate transporter [Hortaea werneckii]